jgi:hypothetical protein
MTLVKTHTGKTSSLRPVGCISDQFPTTGIPATSLHLTRQVSVSHDKSGSDWRGGPDAQRETTTRAPQPTHVEE